LSDYTLVLLQKLGELNAKIVVVEDNIVNPKVIRWFLESMGQTCDVVPKAAASLQAVTENSYGLVLMDLPLPAIDGCTTAKFMRESGFTMPALP
jgi:CheY-like chemotaxis protein